MTFSLPKGVSLRQEILYIEGDNSWLSLSIDGNKVIANISLEGPGKEVILHVSGESIWSLIITSLC